MYETTTKSTQHGKGTPHGWKTPHRFPTSNDKNFTFIFADLARQLYPTGRAWRMKFNSVFYRFHAAINVSLLRFVEDCKFTTDSAFPDNDNFSVDDASLWEYRLGLTTNTSLTLATRKKAIRRKMAHPGNVRARQHKNFIEWQLREAGFDVYVHENVVPYQSPNDILLTDVSAIQHGEPTQHGNNTQHGGGNFQVVANLAAPSENYSIGAGNLWSTFFIGGENLGDFAVVPQSRLKEFKELILRLKPAHTTAFLFVNFN